MRRFAIRYILILVVVLAGWTIHAEAQTNVRVLGYPFPPFVNEDRKTGLTPQLLTLLNNLQQDYKFTLTVVDPDDRYEALLSDRHDMILFEMPKWDWQDKMEDLLKSRVLMKGGEVYVARREPSITQAFFSEIKSKRIGVYEGYHYKFANYNSDKKWLRDNFRVSFANRHRSILDMVETSRVDIGVITLSFLKQYFAKNPEEISKFRVSNEFAQVYELRALIKEEANISVQKFEKLLSGLKKDFVLEEFLEKNGILHQWRF